MSWHPADLVTDADLLAYETTILTQFNKVDWAQRRAKAIEDWLFPLVEARGFDPQRFRTRHQPTSVLGYTSSAFTDRTSAANTSDGVNLATVLAGGSDALYIGFARPFRGVLLAMHELVNSTVDAALSAAVWTGVWTNVRVADDTKIGLKGCARGGSLTWELPPGLIRRQLNNSDALYWVKLTAASVLTGASAGPLTVIQRSRLAAAVTFRTLELIFTEAQTDQEGPWRDKVEKYGKEATDAFDRVVNAIGPEFDSDDDDAIDGDEETQTAESAGFKGVTLERA